MAGEIIESILMINILQAINLRKTKRKGFACSGFIAPNVVVVTTYEPDPNEWINCRIRR